MSDNLPEESKRRVASLSGFRLAASFSENSEEQPQLDPRKKELLEKLQHERDGLSTSYYWKNPPREQFHRIPYQFRPRRI